MPFSPESGPDSQSLDILQAYNEALSELQVKLQSLNSYSGAFANTLQGNFASAGKALGETRNPILRLNASLISSQKNFKSLGVDMESIMTRASYRADILSRRMESFKSKVTSIPQVFKNKLQEGLNTESEKISASSGIMRAGYSDSINESQKIISEVRKIVIKESAPLPGNTATHLTVLSNTIDDAMKMAKDAGKTISEAQKFAAETAGSIGAIGGASNATAEQTIRFSNALMSGSLSPNSQMDLVERNPAMKDAMKSTLRTFGVSDFNQISRPKRMEATQMMLSKAMPKDQLEASSSSLGGSLEGLKTVLSSMTDFTRTVTAFEGYKGPDLTVFEELKPIIIGLIDPLQKLLESIINNPLTDPMTLLVRNINKVSGFFGGSTKKAADIKDMSYVDANKNLGFLDFTKYIGANSDKLLEAFLKGENKSIGPLNTSGSSVGKDIISTTLQALTSKFKNGVDSMFAEINGFLGKSTFLNGMDLGASIGTAMAQITNSMVYLFNNLLPIIINQTGSLFKGFKDQLDAGAILRFTQLLGTFQAIWLALQDKITTMSETLPKFFNGLSANFTKAGAILGVLGTATMLLTGVFSFAALKVAQVINDLVLFAAKSFSEDGSAFNDNVRNVSSEQRSARERIKLFNSKEDTPEKQALMASGYNAEKAKEDKAKSGDLGFNAFSDKFKEYSAKIGLLGNISPEVAIGNMLGDRSEENTQKNGLQVFSQTLQKFVMPLTMASGAGLVPAPVAATLSTSMLGTGVLGNVLSVLGAKGLTEEERKEKKGLNANLASIEYGETINKFKSGDFKGGMGKIDLIRTNEIGIIGKVLSKLGPIGKLFTSINPAMLAAIGANLPYITGAFGMIISAVKKMYDASPKLQAAVSRFMTGMMNLFNSIKVVLEPLYKKYILPVFKFFGDILAFIFNRLMDFLNFFTGGAFGKEATTDEQATKVGGTVLDERTAVDNAAIEKGDRESKTNGGSRPLNAFNGYVPKMLNAAVGFNVPALTAAATLEQKMAPANSSLIMANTSETILTKEQMQSRSIGESSRASVTVPAIYITVNATENQNETEIANKVAGILMKKLDTVASV